MAALACVSVGPAAPLLLSRVRLAVRCPYGEAGTLPYGRDKFNNQRHMYTFFNNQAVWLKKSYPFYIGTLYSYKKIGVSGDEPSF